MLKPKSNIGWPISNIFVIEMIDWIGIITKVVLYFIFERISLQS